MISGFDYTYSATEANAMVAAGSITNNLVFNRGYEPMLATNATSDEVMYAIAKYVPAVSSASRTACTAAAILSRIFSNAEARGTRRRGGRRGGASRFAACGRGGLRCAIIRRVLTQERDIPC